MILNPQFRALFTEKGVVKLASVISGEDSWNPKPINDAPQDKLPGCLASDLGEGFCLHPFNEVVNGNIRETSSHHEPLGRDQGRPLPNGVRVRAPSSHGVESQADDADARTFDIDHTAKHS